MGSVIDLILVAHYEPRVDPGFKRNGNQAYHLDPEGGQCISLTNIQPLCGDCIEILEALTSWSPKGLSRRILGQI
jgi:hypothetical protein